MRAKTKNETFKQNISAATAGAKIDDVPRNAWNGELKHKHFRCLFQQGPNCQKPNLDKGSSQKTAKDTEPHFPTRTKTQTHHLNESK